MSLFSTNTDGCCFKWALVLLKHDKVRDDTPLVKKVWRSSNASALPFFFQPRQPLVHVSAANKEKMLLGKTFKFICFAVCSRWTWEMEKWWQQPISREQPGPVHKLLSFTHSQIFTGLVLFLFFLCFVHVGSLEPLIRVVDLDTIIIHYKVIINC